MRGHRGGQGPADPGREAQGLQRHRRAYKLCGRLGALNRGRMLGDSSQAVQDTRVLQCRSRGYPDTDGASMLRTTGGLGATAR